VLSWSGGVTRGLIIAAPRSGSGKTTVTLAVLAALRRRGVSVRAAKSGPDYIDPAFHAAATGAPSVNLDSWAMAPELLDDVAGSAWAEAEIFVIESSMGLFDGIGGPPGRRGSAADLAARFGMPVVLVLDVSGQSQSAAAVAGGFARHDPAVHVAGVVLNQVASARHREGVEAAMATCGMPVLGCVMRNAAIALPERHLGLVQAGEHAGLAARLGDLADLAERELDLDAIMAAAVRLAPVARGAAVGLPPPGQRIALARDDAFSFVYPHLLQSWRLAGAEIVPFSPLTDEAPPSDCDIVWLPGGYPELHAGKLAAASRFLDGLRDFARTRPVHGECGGFMVLGEMLEDAQGERYAMAGLLGHSTSFARRKMNLGYREATLLADSPLGPASSRLRGHEFHYASVVSAGADAPLVSLLDGAGRALGTGGGRRGGVSGTFFHAIAPS
jgi:cobyrinic acid a,c-diamide synthase